MNESAKKMLGWAAGRASSNRTVTSLVLSRVRRGYVARSTRILGLVVSIDRHGIIAIREGIHGFFFNIF